MSKVKDKVKAPDASGSSNGLLVQLDRSELLAITLDPAGKILYCNRSLAEAVGYASDELKGKNVFDVLIPGRLKKSYYKVLQDVFYRLGYSTVNKGIIITREKVPLEIRFINLIFHNQDQQACDVTILGENITPRVKFEKAIHRSGLQLKELFDNANDLIQVFAIDGSILYVNDSWKRKLGYHQEDLYDLKLKQVVAPEYYEITKQRLFRIANGDSSVKVETVFISKSGKRYHLSGNINPRYFRGNVVEFQAIFHDITEQVRAEKAQSLYYSIANLTIHSSDLDSLFHNIHRELKKVVEATNFYLALLSDDDKYIYFPYLVDQFRKENYLERPFGNGITEYAIQSNRPLYLTDHEILKLQQEGILRTTGRIPKIWLGVPLRLGNRVIGIIAVQSYQHKNAYSYSDLELLDFISGQVALSIERKRSEEKINFQNARIQAVFENGTHLVWTLDKNFNFTSFNRNFAGEYNKYFGKYPEIGERYDRQLGDTREKLLIWENYYDQAFTGKPVNFEVCLQNIEQESWKEIFLNPILSAENQIQEVSGIGHDITEKKHSELALLESEEKYRNIFESFQDIYFRCSIDGTLTTVSPSITELVGYLPKDVIGADITDYYLYTSKTKRLIRELIEHKAVRNFEASIIQKDGGILQCICNVRFIYNQNQKPVEIEGVARDITQLKRTNQELIKAKDIAEKSSKVKDQFLANMSHEIRTPMNGIIGMIDLLSGTSLNKEQKNYIQTIKKSSETLLNILNDILDLSKIEAGKMKLKKSPVRIKSTMEKLYAMFSQQALSRNTNLYYHIDKRLPEYLVVDETRLLQILSNLTSNAIKFTEGGGSIDIGLKKYGREGDQVILKVDVTDSGIGISQQNLDKLFLSFNQLDGSYSKPFGGTGLGLAISKELCKLMGGDIGVSSIEGLGSTFWFTFKAEIADAQVVEEKEAQNEEFDITNYFEGKKPRILLVDDNLVNRQVAGEILKKSGCRVDFAVSGIKAIEKVQQKRYDLVFMDIQMPDMDGVTATRKIKELKIKKLAPIVAMTAYSMKEDREKFLKEGLDDYIPKPIRAFELIKKVQEWVKFEPKTPQKSDIQFKNKENVINLEVIQQLKKYGGDEMVIKVFSDFEEETKELLEMSKISLKNRNYQNILSNLHTLKGNAGTLGIEKVAKYAEYIESNLKKDNFETLEQDLAFLKLTFSEFQHSYQKIINS